jgi:hypothetical protein
MRFYTLSGKLVSKNISKYAVNWDKPCRSKVQFATKQFLRPFWSAYICVEEMPVTGTLLKVDFVNLSLKIAVEVNGNQHEKYNPFFHKGNPANYLKGFKNDAKKGLWLEKNGFQLVEIYENEVPLLSREFFKDKFDITL